MIRFLLNGTLQELSGFDPTRTVLNWLRYDMRHTGTKEGCAEGDCGACTVLIGELRGDRLVYRAVNSCIWFLPMLDGREVITVEGLSRDGTLHPAQQAMVDCHGSQCGFCTPGFVMSLAALYEDRDPALTRNVNDVLAGNLCRCTGYGPIKLAAERMRHYEEPAGRIGNEQARERLRALQRRDGLSLTCEHKPSGTTRRFFAPRSSDELADVAAAYPEAIFLAGATDVGLWVTKQHRVLETLISVTEVEDLQNIEETDESLEIGAGVRLSDAWGPLTALHPDLGELLRRFGSVQVRNSATLGGNIANGSPIGDSMPALIALGTRIVLRRAGSRRELPLEDYFIEYGRQDRRPGEFIEKIIIPKPRASETFRAFKISKRFDQDISALCGAFSLTLSDGHVRAARIAFGGMAPTPKRARACEAAITGRRWEPDTVEAGALALAGDYTPISDMRASAAYRLRAARNLLHKVYLETACDGAPTRLVDIGAAHA